MAPSEPPLGNGGARLPRTHATDNVYDVMLREVVSTHEHTEDYPYPSFTLDEFCQRFHIGHHWEFYYGVYPRIMRDRKHFSAFVESYSKNNGKYPPEETYYFMLNVFRKALDKLPFESNGAHEKIRKKFVVPTWEAKQHLDTRGMGKLVTALKTKADLALLLRETLPIKASAGEIAEHAAKLDKLLKEWNEEDDSVGEGA